MPGSGTARLGTEPYLKGHALVWCERCAWSKIRIAKTRTCHSDAADGKADVTGVFESDVLTRGGLQSVIAKTDCGGRHLHSGEGFFRHPGERD